MPESTIITEQYVRISQTAASIGERILSFMIDLIVVFVYCYCMGVLLSLTSAGPLVYVFLLVLPAVMYPFLCEMFNGGQSVGKYFLHLRVVKLDGSTPSIGAYLLRWLFLLVDGVILCGGGVLVVMLTTHSQRIGDLVAGTMVIREKDYRKIHVSLDEFDFLTKNYRPVYPQAADLSLEQINVISRTLALPPKDEMEKLPRLASKVKQVLSVVPKESTDKQFLQRIIRDYQYYALEEI
jgi:uncharacterized RDD family membrane protein YckC